MLYLPFVPFLKTTVGKGSLSVVAKGKSTHGQ